MSNSKILFFAANPRGTAQLALEEESREIEQKIRAAEHHLELITKWAVRPDDLLQYLNQHRPQVVHFSGHGSLTDEITLLDNAGNPKAVTKAAIIKLFTTLKDNIRVVVLNGCFSRLQAEAITEVIDCAVGMNKAIGDDAAIAFAASFYRALGFGRSLHEAFDQGKTALMLQGISEENTPELLVRQGTDPRKIFLAGQIVGPAPDSTVVGESVVWPAPQEFKRVLADRERESDLFLRMITGQSPERLLLLRGESGHGKTALLNEFYRHASKLLGPKACAVVDLKLCPPIEEVFQNLRVQLGDHILPEFSKCEHPGEQDAFRLLRDLQNSRYPVLLLFDTYQDASDHVQKWVLRLLHNSTLAPGLVVVITGKQVPSAENATWAALATQCELRGISDVRYWHEFVVRKWKHLDTSEMHLDTLAIYTAGVPSLMYILLENWSRCKVSLP